MIFFTDEDKAFVKIFVPYYRLWTTESYERIPWQTMKYVLIAQQSQPHHEAGSKLLKKGISKRTHGVAYRRLRVSLTSDAIGIRIKACMLVKGGYFEHRIKTR